MPFGETHDNSTTPPLVEAPSLTWKEVLTDFRRREWWLFVITVLTIVCSLGSLRLDWTGNEELHTVMESVATILAFVVGALTLVRYYANGSVLHLWVGAAFVGTGFLDGSHLFLTSS